MLYNKIVKGKGRTFKRCRQIDRPLKIISKGVNIMEKTIRFADPQRQERTVPINVIRQFPERPSEWAKNRIIIIVTAGRNGESGKAASEAVGA